MQRRSVRQGALDGVAVRLEAVRLQDAAQRRWRLHVEVGVHLHVPTQRAIEKSKNEPSERPNNFIPTVHCENMKVAMS